jgi:hypothetical protein
MKPDRLWCHLAIALAGAVVLYIAMFLWLEHRRTRLGPWEVTFVHQPPASPRLIVAQPRLNISDVQIALPTHLTATATNVTLRFDAGRTVPFEVPFGQCTYQDPLFLPGVVALDVGGQKIQMFRRALSINGVEHAWEPGLRIDATGGAAVTNRVQERQ